LLFNQTPLGVLKIFYLYDENNIPAKLTSVVNPKKFDFTMD